MPPGWTTLPMDPRWPPPTREAIAVYTKIGLTKHLTYEGFICPRAHEKMPLSAFMTSPDQTEMRFGKKYEMLKAKIRAEEAEAEAEARHVPEDQKSGDTNSAASSELGQSVKVELSTMSDDEDVADESKQWIKEEATFTSGSESIVNYPLHFDGDSLHPALGGTGERQDFMFGFDPWDIIGDMAFLNCEPVEEDPSFQWLSPARCADMYHTPEEKELPSTHGVHDFHISE